MPDWTRRLLKEIGYWAKYLFRLRSITSRNPILIYQMGKVGSSTVAETIEGLNLGRPVLHLHTLSAPGIRHAVRRQRASQRPFLPEHLVTSRLLARKLRVGSFPCSIITLTRAPIPRAISFVFQDLIKQAPEALTAGNIDTEKVRMALDELLTSENGISDPTHWFDSELRDVFGIDVFSRDYDFDSGYTIFQKGPVSVLLIRMEDLDRALTAGLEEFFGIPVVAESHRKANVGADKWYASSLDDLKSSFAPSVAVAQRVFNTKFYRHFYGKLAETKAGARNATVQAERQRG